MAKRSDINFIDGNLTPLQQLTSYTLGGPTASKQMSPIDVVLSTGATAGGSSKKGETVEGQQAGAFDSLGGQNTLMGESIAKTLGSHITKNVLLGTGIITPIGALLSLAMNQGTKALTGGTPGEWVSAALKDAFGGLAPAGYESNLSWTEAGTPLQGSGIALNAIANAVNTNDSSTTGYGSGINGVGGPLGGGFGSMAGPNAYGQGGSYGGGKNGINSGANNSSNNGNSENSNSGGGRQGGSYGGGGI